MPKKTLLVLAAGMGSRYGGLKQIDPVGPNGEIILDYSIWDAKRAGFDKVVFVIRKDIEKDFRESVGKRWEGKIDLDYAFQDLHDLPAGYTVPEGRVKPWGTAHAVLAARNLIRGPFAAINADDFYGAGGYRALADAFDKAAGETEKTFYMVGFRLDRTLSENGSVSRGICATVNGYLTEIEERTGILRDAQGIVDDRAYRMNGSEIASMNFWGFEACFMDMIQPLFEDFLKARGTELKSEFYLPASVFTLIQNKMARVKVLSSEDNWFGVTYREDKPMVLESIAALIKAGKYPEHLF